MRLGNVVRRAVCDARSSTAVLSGNAAAHSVREGCSVATRDDDRTAAAAISDDSRKPLSAPWLACLCKFLESSGLWLVIVVQSLVKVIY